MLEITGGLEVWDALTASLLGRKVFNQGACAKWTDWDSMQKRVVFIDVDDTLVRSVGSKRIPMPAVIGRVRQLKEEGAELFLWSSGGAEYARLSAEELGITDCFIRFLPKPHANLDDQPVHEWELCRHIYPADADSI